MQTLKVSCLSLDLSLADSTWDYGETSHFEQADLDEEDMLVREE